MTNIETYIHFGLNVLVYYSTDNVSFNEFGTASDIFKRVSKMFSRNIFEVSRAFLEYFKGVSRKGSRCFMLHGTNCSYLN